MSAALHAATTCGPPTSVEPQQQQAQQPPPVAEVASISQDPSASMNALRAGIELGLQPLRQELHDLCQCMALRTESLEGHVTRVEQSLGKRIEALELRFTELFMSSPQQANNWQLAQQGEEHPDLPRGLYCPSSSISRSTSRASNRSGDGIEPASSRHARDGGQQTRLGGSSQQQQHGQTSRSGGARQDRSAGDPDSAAGAAPAVVVHNSAGTAAPVGSGRGRTSPGGGRPTPRGAATRPARDSRAAAAKETPTHSPRLGGRTLASDKPKTPRGGTRGGLAAPRR